MPANYISRAQFKGMLRWLCTSCLTTNKHQIGLSKPYVTCRGCSRSREVRFQIWETVRGNHKAPPDIILPENAAHIRPIMLRCQLIGMLKVSCPNCGHLFRRRTVGTTWRIECANTRPPESCGRSLVIGVRLIVPEEPTVPMEAFQQARLAGTWRSNMQIHSED
jgi:hypothetical protein